MDATSGTGTAYPSGAPYFTPRFCWGFFWGGGGGGGSIFLYFSFLSSVL